MPTARCNYWWDDDVKFGLKVTTAPTVEPVSVADVKANAIIDSADSDLWIQGRIKAARILAEAFLKRAFVEQSITLVLDEVPEVFYMPRPPLLSVTTFKYRDANGTLTTISASDYLVDVYTEPGRIAPAYGASWPTARAQINAVEVVYKAGYGSTAASVPQNIRDAIVMTVTQWFENRGETPQGATSATLSDLQLPSAAKALLRASAWGYLP